MNHSEVEGVLTTVGSQSGSPHEGYISVQLIDAGDRDIAADSLVKIVREELKAVPGFFFTVAFEPYESFHSPIFLPR